MARPRSFDEDKALDAAVACFWSRGLEATLDPSYVKPASERLADRGYLPLIDMIAK